jgi:hypothetical protein
VYPGNTVAPASLQTPNDCRKVVCDGTGSDTQVDDSSDVAAPSGPCAIPQCCGSNPAVPCYDNAPIATPCASNADLFAILCGDPSNSHVAGKCVECNLDSDCLKINDAGTLSCDTTTGNCF